MGYRRIGLERSPDQRVHNAARPRPDRLDSGLARSVLALQRTAGNRAVSALLQRDAAPAQPAAGPLSNARFADLPRLVDIAAGGTPMSATDHGAPVQAVQSALVDVGYSLLRTKPGKYTDEMAGEVDLFRTDRGMAKGGLDATAMVALDKAAPPPGKAKEHLLDYKRLLADKKLDVTLAIGFDERGSHAEKILRALYWLDRNGFVEMPVPPDTVGQVKRYAGTYPKGAPKEEAAFTVNVTLITPGKGSKQAYAKALNESEIMIYTGHARRGIGPDFDGKKSPAENFVLGVHSALHKAGRLISPSAVEQQEYKVYPKNDLEAMKDKFDPDKYRVWFFNACTTLAYKDEIRGGLLPEKMNRKNLDLFGSTKNVPSVAGGQSSLAFLEGVLQGATMEDLVRRVQKVTNQTLIGQGSKAKVVKEHDHAYFREGAGDNPETAGVGRAPDRR